MKGIWSGRGSLGPAAKENAAAKKERVEELVLKVAKATNAELRGNEITTKKSKHHDKSVVKAAVQQDKPVLNETHDSKRPAGVDQQLSSADLDARVSIGWYKSKHVHVQIHMDLDELVAPHGQVTETMVEQLYIITCFC